MKLKMEEKEIELNEKKTKITTKLPKEYIEDNNLTVDLDDTTPLDSVVEEVQNAAKSE